MSWNSFGCMTQMCSRLTARRSRINDEESVEAHLNQFRFMSQIAVFGSRHAGAPMLFRKSINTPELLIDRTVSQLLGTTELALYHRNAARHAHTLPCSAAAVQLRTWLPTTSAVEESIVRAVARVCNAGMVTLDKELIKRIQNDALVLAKTSVSIEYAIKALIQLTCIQPCVIWIRHRRLLTLAIKSLTVCQKSKDRARTIILFGSSHPPRLNTSRLHRAYEVPVGEKKCGTYEARHLSLSHRPSRLEAPHCPLSFSRLHGLRVMASIDIGRDAAAFAFNHAMHQLLPFIVEFPYAESTIFEANLGALRGALMQEQLFQAVLCCWAPLIGHRDAILESVSLHLIPAVTDSTESSVRQEQHTKPAATKVETSLLHRRTLEMWEQHRAGQRVEHVPTTLMHWMEGAFTEQSVQRKDARSSRTGIQRPCLHKDYVRRLNIAEIAIDEPNKVDARAEWETFQSDETRLWNRVRNIGNLAASLHRCGVLIGEQSLESPWLCSSKLKHMLERQSFTSKDTRIAVLLALKTELAIRCTSNYLGTCALQKRRALESENSYWPRMFRQHLHSAELYAGQITWHLHPDSLERALATLLHQRKLSSELPLSHKASVHHDAPGFSVPLIAQDKHEKALLSHVVNPRDVGVNYDSIGGLYTVKEALRQAITYPLKYPHLYISGIATEAVKGVLLFGPPGTGKTMLAKAVATEGGASFLTIDASAIENKWLGESEKNARAVFTLARKLAPCVIFIDEIDSILSSREHDESSHGTMTSVKTTLMQEWDGLRTTADRVVVIGSTNRPYDLDEAVLRRMPRRIFVDLPDARAREEILRVTLSTNAIAPNVNLSRIAALLGGYSGSDIREVCREAVLRVAHSQATILEHKDAWNTRTIQFDAQPGELQKRANLDAMREWSLRLVGDTDFTAAIQKLSSSVAEHGPELLRIIEWNERYGEYRRRQLDLGKSTNLYL